MLHTRTMIETWRREYNEERPRKALGRLTLAAYAKQLTESATVSPDSRPLLKAAGRRRARGNGLLQSAGIGPARGKIA